MNSSTGSASAAGGFGFMGSRGPRAAHRQGHGAGRGEPSGGRRRKPSGRLHGASDRGRGPARRSRGTPLVIVARAVHVPAGPRLARSEPIKRRVRVQGRFNEPHPSSQPERYKITLFQTQPLSTRYSPPLPRCVSQPHWSSWPVLST